jgi:hypothetical protein
MGGAVTIPWTVCRSRIRCGFVTSRAFGDAIAVGVEDRRGGLHLRAVGRVEAAVRRVLL